MKKMKHNIIILVSFLIILTVLVPFSVQGASYADDSNTVIKLTTGSGKINVNGETVQSEKPFRSGKVLYIPLRTVLESMGAEVDWVGNGVVNILFKDISVVLTVDQTKITVNQYEKTLPAPPKIVNGSVMIPVDLLSECFEVDIKSSASSSVTTITFNDGSLADLSFLIGSISSSKVGNSYFGWSMNIPKGSRVTSKTFSSKYVLLENEHKGIALEIFTELAADKSIDQYYQEIMDNPEVVLKGDLIDSNLNELSNPAYMDLFYTDSYDEAVYQRIYAGEKYFYNVCITSMNETNPEVLKNDKSLKEIVNSFKLDYAGGLSDTTDLSSVKFGLAQYNNYVTSNDTGKKFFLWEMSVSPEWDILPSRDGNPYNAEIGADSKEKISVEVTTVKDKTNAEAYGISIKSFYASNFNPDLYQEKSAGLSTTAGYQTYNMVYDVKIGKNYYRYDERFLVSGGLVYDITFKAPLDSFDSKMDNYNKILATFKPSVKESAVLNSEIDNYAFNNDKSRMGKGNNPVAYENKNYRWKVQFPGFWQKNSIAGQSLDSFYNPESGAIVMIEAVEKNNGSDNEADVDKFLSMGFVAGSGIEPEKTEFIQAKGKNIKVYKYRLDEEASETYADVYYYIIEGDSYSYCFFSTIPDLTASEYNLNELEGIWDSFTLVDKTAE